MTIIAAIIVTMTSYAPACGGINGSLRNRYADNSSTPQVAHNLTVAACGARWKLGTVLDVRGAERFGVTRVVCRDRGSAVRGIDVLSYTGDGCAVDRAIAMDIGKRRVEVMEVTP